MAHKTLIGGTAYEISGGKTLVNGTAYSIDKGKTLVDGTAYEVGFATNPVVVMVFIPDGSGKRAVIDDVIYTESGTYEGLEKVTVTVNATVSGSSIVKGSIYLNRTKVAQASGTSPMNTKSASYTLALGEQSKVKVIYYRTGTDCHICEDELIVFDLNFKNGFSGALYANEGTWAEYLNSEYKHTGISSAGNYVTYDGNYISYNGENVLLSDMLICCASYDVIY